MKVLLVATVQSHIAQFHTGAIELLKSYGAEIHIAARNNLNEKNGLTLPIVDKIFDIPFNRSPISYKNIKAYRLLKEIIKKEEYDIVHCNTPVGGMLSRLAAKKQRKKGTKVIYTAHGFHFYKGAPALNWILYYPIEKLMAKWTDILVTINKEDYKLAKNKFNCQIFHTHGVGVKTQKYDSVTEEQARKLRKDKGWDKYFLILCTGELNKNKNQITLVKAMNIVEKKHPDVKLLLAGNGPNKESIQAMINKLNLSKNIELLGYRTDLEWFVKMCDLAVSSSFREGLPVNVLEAMYCGKALILSNNRGHRELVQNGQNGYIVDPRIPEEFAEKIIELYGNEKQRNKFEKFNLIKVIPYTDVSVKQELEILYGFKERK